ncbi:MAG: IgGFc-binding protein [Nannocystaceae bacterium]
MASHFRPAQVLLALSLAAPACGDSGHATDGATESASTSAGPGTGTATATVGPTSASETGSTSTSQGSDTTRGTATESTGDVTTTGEPSTGDVTTTGEPPCPADTLFCDGDTVKVCDGRGGSRPVEVCPEVCVDGIGCALCVPGSGKCEGDQASQCNAGGDGYDLVDTCDPLLGLACDEEAGACVGACADLGLSYIGCEYYPTVVQQYDTFNTAPAFVYAVAVANASDKVADVTVTRADAVVAEVAVQPGTVELVTLPWIKELSAGYGASVVVTDGAYRLRSTNPVTVYQYNPLTATQSNDASVLLPTNTWTGNYLVAAWPTWAYESKAQPGLYAVTAREDGTTVVLHPSATGKIVKAGGGVAADGSGVVLLDRGDVLQVLSDYNGDLTGTIVEADRPVQVIGGHKCSFVPLDVIACDHLEESMFPIETLAKEYVVVPPVQVPNDALEKGQIVRVIASEPDTTLVFTPDQPVNKALAEAGDFVEIKTTTAKFVVSADKKILVAQFMVGQAGGYGTSDPAMLLAVSPQQWRKSYLFHAATNWQANYVDILAPMNAAVTVDGVDVDGWQPIGATNYQVAHVKLTNENGGNHSVAGDVGVGISVYGVQNYGSYWYPGGLDLDLIPQ